MEPFSCGPGRGKLRGGVLMGPNENSDTYFELLLPPENYLNFEMIRDAV